MDYINIVFTGAIPIKNAYYGRGAGPVLMSYVSCAGNEQFLTNCTSHRSSFSQYCSYARVAGVQCPGIRVLFFINNRVRNLLQHFDHIVEKVRLFEIVR